MNFELRLKELLSDRNISQKEFAHGIGVAPPTAGNYVRGLREPDYETLKRIAAFFHVSIDFLLGLQCEMANDSDENELLLIFRALNPDKQELLIAQGKLLLKKQ